MKHFLLTRFNEYFPDAFSSYWVKNSNLGTDKEWLKRRIKIFFQATFPTVLSQSNKNFTWIIKCHHKTPQWAKDELANVSKEVSAIVDYERFDLKVYERSRIFNSLYECRFPSNRLICKHFFEKHIEKSVANIVLECTDAETQIITTRLDSDDAIAFDFIEKIQINSQHNRFVDFDSGAIFCNGKFYKFNVPNKTHPSQFCSFQETISNKLKTKTVFFVDHTEANPCDYIKDVGWLQINHNMCLNNHNIFPRTPVVFKNWKERFKGIKNVVF
jgi:hypothetical protein